MVMAVSASAGCDIGVDLDPALADAPMPARYDPVDADLADAGAWLFQHNCSACHHLGDVSMIGPDLAGVTERRSLEWIAAMIRRPDSMLVADTIARRLLAQYQVPMANRRLDGARVRALVEFLRRADIGPGPSDIRTGRTPAGIAWERAGSGPAVVLIHGTNLDREVWRAVRHHLGVDHSVVSYDLRSHGASADAEGPWSDLDDLTEVLDAAGVERSDPVTLVGLSAGAGIALEFALDHGDRIRRLVLVSPSVRGFVPAEGDVPDVFGPLMAALGTGDSHAIGEAMVGLSTFQVGAREQADVDAMVRRNLRLFEVDPSWALMGEGPPLDRLAGLDTETVVLVGGRDFQATSSLADRLTREITPSTRISVADGGHLLPVIDPDAVLRAILLPYPELRP
jgi:2-succinyl-6-hydroxy-2,4-cyclohexadiene-1-carboxylate synthase